MIQRVKNPRSNKSTAKRDAWDEKEIYCYNSSFGQVRSMIPQDFLGPRSAPGIIVLREVEDQGEAKGDVRLNIGINEYRFFPANPEGGRLLKLRIMESFINRGKIVSLEGIFMSQPLSRSVIKEYLRVSPLYGAMFTKEIKIQYQDVEL